jgi:Ca2+-binding RTX toxin-like protein
MATLFVNSDGSVEFTTIFAAIEAASAGDIIDVAAGTYNEDLLIDKAVTILGAQDGVDGTDALRDAALGVGETTIVGLSRITASGDVTIDGVRFLNDVSTTGGGSILRVESEGNHVITNSIFYSEVNGAANGVADRAISIPPLTTGTVEISNNYFTGAAEGAFSDASWDRGIFFDGGGIDVTIEGNTFEFTRTGINLDDTSGVSPATVAGNTFITNGTGTSVAFNLDNVSFADNNYEDTREDFNFRNLTTDIVFDAEVAVAAVTPVNPVVDAVVVLGGTGNDTISGTAGADVLDANASGISVADNDTLEGRGGNDLLVGRGGADTLKGGEGTDVLLGGAGNDILDGEQGDDQVIGGDGDDTYIYRPGSAADTFNGFVAGLNTVDHVDISAFTGITSFAQVLSLATQVGEDTVIDFGGGDVLTLANVLMGSLAEEDFGFAPPLAPPRPTNDFDGDSKSDILWQDDNGTAAVWLMDGPTPTFVGAVGTNPGPTWEIKGTGDFNGDGKSDIIWQGDDGTASMWLMDGTNATFVGAVGTNPGPTWDIIA